MSSTLSLNCFILGGDLRSIFSVHIDSAKTIGDLQKLIKKEKHVAFNAIDANTLVLAKVSIAIDIDFEKNVEAVMKESLQPHDFLSSVFNDLQIDHVHVLVELPQKPQTIDDSTNAEVLGMIQRYKKLVEEIAESSRPINPYLKDYLELQYNLPIYNGRVNLDNPISTMAPPVQLFHPVFAHFRDDIAKVAREDIPSDVLRATVAFMRSSSSTEADERRLALTHLATAICIGAVDRNATSLNDNLILNRLPGSVGGMAAILLYEGTDDFSGEGVDPSTKVSVSMAQFWAQDNCRAIRNSTCCPTFLLARSGSWFTVLGAVFTDKLIIQHLTDFVWAGEYSILNTSHCFTIANILHALGQNLIRLKEYYLKIRVDRKRTDRRPLYSRFFPSINAYRDETTNEIVEFAYIGALHGASTCVTFGAETIQKPPKIVVVKFVERYGEAPHRLLERHNLAPQLLYHGNVGINADDPTYGHLRMVVMEYLDGDTLYESRKDKGIPSTVFEDLTKALNLLHSNSFVFGDFRDVNVMVKAGHAKIIDFEWAGKKGTARYPLSISTQIPWAHGVEGGNLIEEEHDLEMLKRFIM